MEGEETDALRKSRLEEAAALEALDERPMPRYLSCIKITAERQEQPPPEKGEVS